MSVTATPVSTRRSGALALVGIAQRPDEVVIDLRACAWDQEKSVPLIERLRWSPPPGWYIGGTLSACPHDILAFK